MTAKEARGCTKDIREKTFVKIINRAERIIKRRASNGYDYAIVPLFDGIREESVIDSVVMYFRLKGYRAEERHQKRRGFSGQKYTAWDLCLDWEDK